MALQADDSFDEIYMEAARTGSFDLRDKVGQAFYRSPKSKCKDYKILKNGKEKELFRKQWALDTYSGYLKEKSHVHSFAHVDTERGEYLSLGAVVAKLRGWKREPAIRGACRMATMLEAMGGHLLKFVNRTCFHLIQIVFSNCISTHLKMSFPRQVGPHR